MSASTIGHKLLLDTPPLVLQKEMAVALNSLDKAVVLQQIHFCCYSAKEQGAQYKYRDGRWWVYNSYPDWKADHFPFWSESKIGRILRELEEEGLIIAAQLDAYKYNQSKWYAVDYDALNQFIIQNDTIDDTEMIRSTMSEQADQSLQDDTIMSKTSSETTTNIEGARDSTAGEQLERLRDKFGSDPAEGGVKAWQRLNENRDRAKGYEDATEGEYRVCQRVAQHWMGGKMRWATDDIRKDLAAANKILEWHGDNARAAIRTIDVYYAEVGEEPGFDISGPYSLRNVIAKRMESMTESGEVVVKVGR